MKSTAVCIAMVLCSSATSTARADADAERDAFNARCAKCHNEAGTGTFMLARRVGKERSLLAERNDLAPALIRHVVRNGIGSMPPLTRVEVTDNELNAISRYLTRHSPTP